MALARVVWTLGSCVCLPYSEATVGFDGYWTAGSFGCCCDDAAVTTPIDLRLPFVIDPVVYVVESTMDSLAAGGAVLGLVFVWIMCPSSDGCTYNCGVAGATSGGYAEADISTSFVRWLAGLTSMAIEVEGPSSKLPVGIFVVPCV